MGYTRIRTYAVAVLLSIVLFGVAHAADSITLVTAKVVGTTDISTDGTYDIDAANEYINIEQLCKDTKTGLTTAKSAAVDKDKKTWLSTMNVSKGTYDVTGRLYTKPNNAKLPMYFTDSNSKQVEVK